MSADVQPKLGHTLSRDLFPDFLPDWANQFYQAKKAEGRFCEDGGGNVQNGLRHDQRDDLRQDVAQDDAGAAGSDGTGAGDELALFERQHL